MWLILPPSTSSLSAPASEDSTSDLTLQQAERAASSAGLSGTPRPAKSWRRAWRTRPSLRSLSGLTCEPSTADAGVDAWISSLRATRASRSVTLADALDRTILATFGRTSLASLARLNPASCSSRTSPDTSLSGSMLFAPISDASATELRRDCSRRQRLARRTGGSGCSSWASPRTSDTNGAGEHGEGGTDLRTQVAGWSTPKVSAWGWTNSREGVRPTLQGEAEMWPTPMAADDGHKVTPASSQAGLIGAADQWWPTARSTDHKDSRASNNGTFFDRTLLDAAIDFHSGPLAPATSTDGDKSLSVTPTSRPRLNPAFVEWLMGLPAGWTDFASAATAWSLWQRRMRSSLFGLVCGRETK